MADIASDVVYISQVVRPAPAMTVETSPTVAARSWPPPESSVERVQPLPTYFRGQLQLSSPERPSRSLPELRVGLRPACAGPSSYIAMFYSDMGGRFSFRAPLAGHYTVALVDPDYEGSLDFSTDGKTTLPAVLALNVRPKPQVGPTSESHAAPSAAAAVNAP